MISIGNPRKSWLIEFEIRLTLWLHRRWVKRMTLDELKSYTSWFKLDEITKKSREASR